MDKAKLKDRARAAILGQEEALLGLSHEIHTHPELAFEETRAARRLTEMLADDALVCEAPFCDLSTAFRAQVGAGQLQVAVCAEYDALPEVGHACGHNIIAAAALGVGFGLKELVSDLDVSLSIIGTPAEENGGGKIVLLERGAFEGVHAAMMIHPGPYDLLEPRVIGVDWLEVSFEGKPAHASAFPEKGVNAADAVVMAHTAIGLLRQHITSTERVHGVILSAGDAPNVIPASSKATYMVRSPTLEGMDSLRRRVERCFEAGALATGCRIEYGSRRRPYEPMRHDQRLSSLFAANAAQLGRRFLDAEEVGLTWAASTDMGNVSQAVPSTQPMLGLHCAPAVNHQPEFAAAAVSAAGDAAVLDGALAMAFTIIDIACNADLRRELVQNRRPSAAENLT